MPDPVVRNSPALYSVPLHFMQEYVCFATVDLLSVYWLVRGLCHHATQLSATSTHARATTALGTHSTQHNPVSGGSIGRWGLAYD